jgi:hypothetical protein
MSQYPELPVELIWAAACQAMSTNNGYIKDVKYSEEHQGKKSNRDLVMFYAVNTDKISEQSIKDGIEVRNYLKGMTFKILAEGKIADYFLKLIKLASDDELKLTDFNAAYIASAPKGVIREQLKDEQAKQVRECEHSYVGVEGEQVQVNFKIIKSHYSQEWERHYVTAITTDNKMITYSTINKRLINVGSVVSASAIVKQHFIDKYTKHETTKLTYVKTGLK